MPQTKKSPVKNIKKITPEKASTKKVTPIKKAVAAEDREIILPSVNDDKLIDDVETPAAEVAETDLPTEESEDEESDLDTFGDSWEE